MEKRFADADVSIMKFNVFSDQGDLILGFGLRISSTIFCQFPIWGGSEIQG